MIISYIFPQMIFIEDEKTLKMINKNFNNYYLNKRIEIGSWFQTNPIFKEEICYVVKPLDTFESVAKKLNISIEELKILSKTKHLFVGQKINILK